jgi:hypothetical protein
VYKASCRQLVLTYNAFAVLCFKRGKYNEAVQLLNKALADEKREAGLYVNRGDCFHHLNNLHFALADYSQAQQLSPEDWHIRYRVAATQCAVGIKEFEGGNLNKADKLFSSAITNNPKVSHFYLCRARVRYDLQQTDQAKEDLFRVLILEPDCDACLPLIARVFPGKKQSDLLNSTEFAAMSTQLMRSVDGLERTAEVTIAPESIAEKAERELRELFIQLGISTESQETASTAEATADGNGDKGSSSSLITPVFAGANLPTTVTHITSSPSSSKMSADATSQRPTAAAEGVSMRDEEQTRCNEVDGHLLSPHSWSFSRVPPRSTAITPPRKWPVLSLPLPPIAAAQSPRGVDGGGWSVMPDRVACRREKEFLTQIYYAKKDCTTEVQREIQSSVLSPPRKAITTRPLH